MTKSATDIDPEIAAASDSPPHRKRWQKELLIALAALAMGLIVLPALIYGFGVVVLGAYGGGPSIWSFYGDYFRDLGSGIVRTWFLVCAPYVLFSVLRLLFTSWKRRPEPADTPPTPPPSRATAPTSKATSKTTQRREPFVSS